MCGTRSTFSRTETKFFAGGTRVEQGQLREVTAMQFARLFPTRKDGYTKKSGAKRQPLDERALWPESKWREIYLSRAHAALDPNREWGQAEANEVRAVGVDAWVREKMQALYADRPPIGIPSSRFLVTNSSPPQAIDRVVKWERTETPTTCGARCRMARGPMCDCVCEGQFHGAGATMSRARFSVSETPEFKELDPHEQRQVLEYGYGIYEVTLKMPDVGMNIYRIGEVRAHHRQDERVQGRRD
jgi:hypothetical protein